MKRCGALGVLLWWVVGCVPPVPGEDVGLPPAPDAGASPDAGTPCPSREDGTCAAVTWSAAPGLPLEVEGHGTAVVTLEGRATALVAGGFTLGADGKPAMRRGILQAALDGEGRPGDWVELAALPRPVAHAAQAAAGSHVYLAGGLTTENGQPVPQRSVYLATLQRHGALRVEELEPLVDATVHASASVAQGWLVVAGGTRGKTLPTVQMAALGADGTAQAFVEGPSLPEARSHHAAITLDGHIYLLGGFRSDGTDATGVLRSVHAVNGVLTGWEEAGSVPAHLVHAPVVARGGQVLLLGKDGGAVATPSADGTLSSWTAVPEAFPAEPGARVMAVQGTHVLGVNGGAVWVGSLW